MENLYQHAAIKQLAKEFGLAEITAREVSESEIASLIEAIKTDRWNPNHYPPAEWVKSFFTFLRQTGEYPNMLESPYRFVQQISNDERYR